MNKCELLTALTKEGCLIQYQDLAFSNEDATCQGVRIYVCKKGRSQVSFACGKEEVIHAVFLREVPSVVESYPCASVAQIVKYMRVAGEEKGE